MTEQEADIRDRLKEHVHKLANEIGERNFAHQQALKAAADYLEKTLESSGYRVRKQALPEASSGGANLEVELGGSSRSSEIVVIGAHYDSVLGCPGANDNASGVAAVLEAARVLAGQGRARTVRFVFFAHEEPPFFGTRDMGSFYYANQCKQRADRIVAMLSLETIGSYSDKKGSQNYPVPFRLFYPDIGNFIAFVSDNKSRDLLFKCISSFRARAAFPSEGIAAPAWVSGIDWSDHWSFWQHDYPAIMITDTAPFRYPHYHTSRDTGDKLDYERTARVVFGLIGVIQELAGEIAP